MENAAPEGEDGLFVRCKSGALQSDRSENPGGAARPLQDHSPDTSAPKCHPAEFVDRRQRPSVRNLPRQSWNKLQAPASLLALLIENVRWTRWQQHFPISQPAKAGPNGREWPYD